MHHASVERAATRQPSTLVRTRESLRGKGQGSPHPSRRSSTTLSPELSQADPAAAAPPRSQKRWVFVHTCPRGISPTASRTHQSHLATNNQNAEDLVPAEDPEAAQAGTKIRLRDEDGQCCVDRSQSVPRLLQPPQRGEVERPRTLVGICEHVPDEFQSALRGSRSNGYPRWLGLDHLASSTWTSPSGVGTTTRRLSFVVEEDSTTTPGVRRWCQSSPPAGPCCLHAHSVWSTIVRHMTVDFPRILAATDARYS